MAKYNRFQVVQSQGNSLSGLCPLLDKDGKPLSRDV